LVDIDADRDAILARAYPLARGTRRAAEILAEADRLAPPQSLERVDEILDFGIDGLHGLLVKLVDIGLLCHRQNGLALRRLRGGHTWNRTSRKAGSAGYCSGWARTMPAEDSARSNGVSDVTVEELECKLA